MSSFFKILISFFIVVLVSIIVFVFIFSNVLNIKVFNFLNTHLENKIKKDLTEISVKIERYLLNIDKNKIEPFLDKFDFSKFIDKSRSRTFEISNELSEAKRLILNTEGMISVKLFDNRSKLIFSSAEEDKKTAGAMLSFNSTDGIEKTSDFYDFNEFGKAFIFLEKEGIVVFKRNVMSGNSAVGVMLFYMKDDFLTDILRTHNYTEFKKPVFLKNKIIILYKPDEVPEDYLFNFSLDEKKIRSIIYKDKSGNRIEKLYRLFFVESKSAGLFTLRFVDNDKFILDKRRVIILFYTFFFTLYLLVLAVILFKKSEVDKLKDKSILFSISIFDEIIKAKTKDELEALHSQFNDKKENFFKDLLGDFKKVDAKDKEILENQMKLIFNKIDESFEKKLTDMPGKVNFDRIELLFEKFIDTIAKKGININTPVNISGKGNGVKPETVNAFEEPEEISELTEVEELEEIPEAESVEEISEVRSVEEIPEAEDVEEIPEAEPVEEFGEVYDMEIEDEASKKDEPLEAESAEEIPGDLEELEEIPEAEEVLAESWENNDLESSDEVIPKVPKEFYENHSERDDELAIEIKEIDNRIDPLYEMLNEIKIKLNAYSLMYLKKGKEKYDFTKKVLIGEINLLSDTVVLDKDDVLTERLYSIKRIIYAKKNENIKNFFINFNMLEGIDKAKTFIIYPVKSFFFIKSIVLLFFTKEIDDSLDNIIETIEEKNIAKLLK